MEKAFMDKLALKATDSTKITFTIPTSMLPYNHLNMTGYDSFKFSVLFKESNDGNQGLWEEKLIDNFLGEVHINLPLYNEWSSTKNIPEDIERTILSLKDLIRHELIHMIQTAIKVFKNLKHEVGLPGKSLRDNKEYDSWGGKILPDGKIDYSKENAQQHAQRDVEFYTRLSDCISEFNLVAKKFPEVLKPALAQFWLTGNFHIENFYSVLEPYLISIYPNKDELYIETYLRTVFYYDLIQLENKRKEGRFFNVLRQNQPLKYQKAVKEFLKNIGL